jgi:hypothetical protein
MSVVPTFKQYTTENDSNGEKIGIFMPLSLSVLSFLKPFWFFIHPFIHEFAESLLVRIAFGFSDLPEHSSVTLLRPAVTHALACGRAFARAGYDSAGAGERMPRMQGVVSFFIVVDIA